MNLLWNGFVCRPSSCAVVCFLWGHLKQISSPRDRSPLLTQIAESSGGNSAIPPSLPSPSSASLLHSQNGIHLCPEETQLSWERTAKCVPSAPFSWGHLLKPAGCLGPGPMLSRCMGHLPETENRCSALHHLSGKQNREEFWREEEESECVIPMKKKELYKCLHKRNCSFQSSQTQLKLPPASSCHSLHS